MLSFFPCVLGLMFLRSLCALVDLTNQMAVWHKSGHNLQSQSEKHANFGVKILYLLNDLNLGVVGEEIAFELSNGQKCNGHIEEISWLGEGSSVWSGYTEFGGSFHVSYSSGVILGEVSFPNDGMKYLLRPKDLSAQMYVMTAVARSVYDRDDSPENIDPVLEIEGEAANLRRQQIHFQQRSVANIRPNVGEDTEPGGSESEDPSTSPPVDTNNILDVMFIFTPQALASVGGSQSSMEALAALSVQLANEAYANSLLPIRMRMVSVATLKDTTYVEKGFTTELNRLRYDYDGFFDDEVNIRTSVGADAVVLFTSDTSYCGLAYLWATADMAFSVVSTMCPHSVAHEVGHNIGCDHDRMTVRDYDYQNYNFGYCWDTSAKSCSRSVMAYAGCVTTGRRTNCPRMPYFSSPLVTQGALKHTTGIATSDNARVIREQLSRAVSWRRSKVPGGLITSAQPSAVPVGRCEPVRIKGFRIGTATSTITSVTLNGVPVQRILSQSLDEVEVLVGLSDMAGTGDIVVTTSSGYQTTLAGAFSYQATSGSFVTDFDSGLGTIWVSTGAADWSVVRYCDAEPCDNPPLTGPVVGAGGSGNFLKVQAFEASDDVASLTATFNRDNTAGGCVEAVTSLSLFYHLWGPHSDLCGGSLTVSMLTVGSAAWTTILTASTVQAQQSDLWLPLQFSFPNPAAVAAIRITADPYSGQATCYYWGSVAVDRINVTKTTTCLKDNCDFISATPTMVPTAVPTARPTTIRPTTAMPFSRQPTVARTPSPTLVVPVVEVVRFECTQTLIGVTSQHFLANPSNVANFLSVAASALNLPAGGTCCATATDDVVQQHLLVSELRRLSGNSLRITYKVEMHVAYAMGVAGERNTSSGDSGTPTLSEEAVTKVNAAQQQLAASVASGDFLSALKQVLSPEIASADFGVAPVSTSSFSTPVSEVVVQSPAPTTAPNSSSEQALDFTQSLMLGLGAVALVLTGGGFWLWRRYYKRLGKDAKNIGKLVSPTPSSSKKVNSTTDEDPPASAATEDHAGIGACSSDEIGRREDGFGKCVELPVLTSLDSLDNEEENFVGIAAGVGLGLGLLGKKAVTPRCTTPRGWMNRESEMMAGEDMRTGLPPPPPRQRGSWTASSALSTPHHYQALSQVPCAGEYVLRAPGQLPPGISPRMLYQNGAAFAPHLSLQITDSSSAYVPSLRSTPGSGRAKAREREGLAAEDIRLPADVGAGSFWVPPRLPPQGMPIQAGYCTPRLPPPHDYLQGMPPIGPRRGAPYAGVQLPPGISPRMLYQNGDAFAPHLSLQITDSSSAYVPSLRSTPGSGRAKAREREGLAAEDSRTHGRLPHLPPASYGLPAAGLPPPAPARSRAPSASSFYAPDIEAPEQPLHSEPPVSEPPIAVPRMVGRNGAPFSPNLSIKIGDVSAPDQQLHRAMSAPSNQHASCSLSSGSPSSSPASTPRSSSSSATVVHGYHSHHHHRHSRSMDSAQGEHFAQLAGQQSGRYQEDPGHQHPPTLVFGASAQARPPQSGMFVARNAPPPRHLMQQQALYQMHRRSLNGSQQFVMSDVTLGSFSGGDRRTTNNPSIGVTSSSGGSSFDGSRLDMSTESSSPRYKCASPRGSSESIGMKVPDGANSASMPIARTPSLYDSGKACSYGDASTNSTDVAASPRVVSLPPPRSPHRSVSNRLSSDDRVNVNDDCATTPSGSRLSSPTHAAYKMRPPPSLSAGGGGKVNAPSAGTSVYAEVDLNKYGLVCVDDHDN